MAIPLRTMKILGALMFSEDRADYGNNGQVISRFQEWRPALLQDGDDDRDAQPAAAFSSSATCIESPRHQGARRENWRKIGAIAARRAKSFSG
jgi:hypothetical protein